MAALADYRTQVQRLLHDANSQFWSVAELNTYINEARLQVVGDTGCYRRLQTGYLSPGIETYAFGTVTGFNVTNAGSHYTAAPTVTLTGGGGTGAAATAVLTAAGALSYITITNGGSGYTSAPTVSFSGGGGSGAAATASILQPNTIDLLNLTFWWGTTRIVLAALPWTIFNARCRFWTNFQGQPRACSVYSYTSVYVQPIPDQAYTVEWDTVVLPDALGDASAEVIPALFQEPVQYWAAYKAKMKEQSWGEAEGFKKQYDAAIYASLRRSMTRRLPNAYA